MSQNSRGPRRRSGRHKYFQSVVWAPIFIGATQVFSISQITNENHRNKKPVQVRNSHGFANLWCGAGSNRRHKDFQSFALPTELPHLTYTCTHKARTAGQQGCKDNRINIIIQLFGEFLHAILTKKLYTHDL